MAGTGHRPVHPQGANVLTSSRSMFRLGALAVFVAASLGAVSVQATDITGAGSSFVYPVISKWSASYAEKTGNRVNYQSIGSGGGIAQIKAGTVDFGASDMPLDEATLAKFGLGQFPDVIGGIVPAFNVAGVAPGKLVLDGTTLSGIFLGSIAKWNDPAIAALNPGVKLPDSKITVVHRSDGSGTSFNFTNYLSKVSADWKAKVGEGTSLSWPAGVGGKGNEGVSAYIRQIPNSIGYVEYAYALKNKIGYAVMKNAAGKVRLTGALLGDIFLGKITTWNDAAIAAANPGATLPSTKINIVHRSDGSGTTFNFSNYLSKVSPDWKTKVGEGTSVQWPGGVGGKGNEGVASYVKQIKGSIGYVELSYALQNKMGYTQLQNAAGNFVQPNAQSFQAAAAGADWAGAKDFNLVITNASGADAWPITATNFILMYKQPKDAKHSADTLAFFKWAFENGQAQAASLDYVPLPPELVKQVEAYWGAEFK